MRPVKALPPLREVHTIALDFDGVFTDNKVWVDEGGRESVRCDRSDGLAFDFVRAFLQRGLLQAQIIVLSKEGNPVVRERVRKMSLDCHHGVKDKLAFMKQHLAGRFPSSTAPFSGLIYLANDLNDLPLMRCAGYAVAPADAHPKVREIAHLVLEQRGGEGFVRAFVERLLGIDQMSPEEIDELVSDC
jgi:YrbI family 3-deoxy-D-manno-octulosonate 8-phosphate phosphatase